MKIFQSAKQAFLLGLAATAAMHALIAKQQDLSPEMDPSTLKQRAKQIANAAVVLGEALAAEVLPLCQ